MKELTAEEFATAVKNSVDGVLLDVRTPDEYNNGHLPGAINMNIGSYEFREQIETLDPAKEYFVYCLAGARSMQACLIMQDSGFQHLHNLKGGIKAWNGEVVRP